MPVLRPISKVWTRSTTPMSREASGEAGLRVSRFSMRSFSAFWRIIFTRVTISLM